MKDLLEYITKNITGEKKITVDESEAESVYQYVIKAPKDVMGLLIGKEGRTIRAIRSLARARAIVDQVNINVNLEER